MAARDSKYRFVRSWDGQEDTFSHPLGLESREWGYEDGCTVMAAIMRSVFLGEPPPFHITFELSDDPAGYKLKLRRFIIKTASGRVELEPLYLTYAGTFGMCGVFRDTLTHPSA